MSQNIFQECFQQCAFRSIDYTTMYWNLFPSSGCRVLSQEIFHHTVGPDVHMNTQDACRLLKMLADSRHEIPLARIDACPLRK